MTYSYKIASSRVVSDKILKLQHQKELVVEAMLNFWIKWKTCNVVTYNVGPNRKNISQLFLSEKVEAFVGKFGCALGGSLQNIWF
jgi:hypothetical protein